MTNKQRAVQDGSETLNGPSNRSPLLVVDLDDHQCYYKNAIGFNDMRWV